MRGSKHRCPWRRRRHRERERRLDSLLTKLSSPRRAWTPRDVAPCNVVRQRRRRTCRRYASPPAASRAWTLRQSRRSSILRSAGRRRPSPAFRETRAAVPLRCPATRCASEVPISISSAPRKAAVPAEIATTPRRRPPSKSSCCCSPRPRQIRRRRRRCELLCCADSDAVSAASGSPAGLTLPSARGATRRATQCSIGRRGQPPTRRPRSYPGWPSRRTSAAEAWQSKRCQEVQRRRSEAKAEFSPALRAPSLAAEMAASNSAVTSLRTESY
mmetsp:Transcript_46779/g.101615  ORF Transcript_46779/g.101615 Transcript_46779/m.101615 type:complete len:272 (+) Transcript_46779:2394-3209(+)